LRTNFLHAVFILVFSSISIFATEAAFSATWSTHLNSGGKTKSKIKPLNPAIEVPIGDKIKWKLSSTINGRKTGENKGAPAYDYSRFGGWSFVGFVPEGTPIVFEHVKTRARIHYYAMDKPDSFIPSDKPARKKKPKRKKRKSKLKTRIWIPGSYIISQ